MPKKVAIIGGGLAGCLTAPAFARKGMHSEIFERNDRELFEASYFNEGKVHLGFLYAHDFSGETSKLMVSGAVTLRTIIAELTGFDIAEALSTPFLYAVHRNSLVSATAFESHLRQCADEFLSSLENDFTSAGYVDGCRKVEHQRLDVSLWNDDLDPEVFRCFPNE